MTAEAYCSRGHYTSPLDFCKFCEKRKNLQEIEISKSDRLFLSGRMYKRFKGLQLESGARVDVELEMKIFKFEAQRARAVRAIYKKSSLVLWRDHGALETNRRSVCV